MRKAKHIVENFAFKNQTTSGFKLRPFNHSFHLWFIVRACCKPLHDQTSMTATGVCLCEVRTLLGSLRPLHEFSEVKTISIILLGPYLPPWHAISHTNIISHPVNIDQYNPHKQKLTNPQFYNITLKYHFHWKSHRLPSSNGGAFPPDVLNKIHCL